MYKNKVWKESRYFCEKYKNNLALGVDPCYQGYHQQRVENDTTISEDDNQFNKIDIVKLSFGFFRREIRSRFVSLIKLLHRSFSICCNLKTFHFEIDLLKLLMKSNYPPNFIDSCIKSFLNKLYTPKVAVPERNVFVKLPFLGSTLFQIRKKLQKLLTSCYFQNLLTKFRHFTSHWEKGKDW